MSVVTGVPCADLVYSNLDEFERNPLPLDWFVVCAGDTDGAANKDLCLPNFDNFDFNAADNNAGDWKFCQGGTVASTDPCAIMVTKENCELLDALVWTETKFDEAGTSRAEVNCLWNDEANNKQGACEPFSPPVDSCEAIQDTANYSFDEARDLCTAKDTAGDEFDCVVASRLSNPEDQKQLCKNIAQGLNKCEADHLQYGADRCRANSLEANVPGYPRCTWVTATPYPVPEMVPAAKAPRSIDIPRPCFESKCDRQVPTDVGYQSFAEYAQACRGTGASPTTAGDNSSDILTKTVTGLSCLPRLTGHDFTGGALTGDAYCSIQVAQPCAYFETEDSCYYASLSVFAERGANLADPLVPTYLACAWTAGVGQNHGACGPIKLSDPDVAAQSCAGKKPAVITDVSNNATYAAFCAAEGYGCIPRGSYDTFYDPNSKLGTAETPYCIQLAEDDVSSITFEDTCALPMFQEEEFCEAVGESMRTANSEKPFCSWSSEAKCVAVDPVELNSCQAEPIVTEQSYSSYEEHVNHCETVKVESGVCLPAEGVYDYDAGRWNVNTGGQCTNYIESTLDCDKFTTSDACEYVDQHVFSVKDAGEDIFFGRRCSYDDGSSGSKCTDSSDPCSAFNAQNLSSYQELVTKCKGQSQDIIVLDQEVLQCVPELQKWDQVNMERNTCQFQPVLDCKSYIAQTRENCTTDVLFPLKTCQWKVENGIGSCSDYVATTCETKLFNPAPTDYDDYYNTCSQLSGPGYVCLPFYEEITNEDGQKKPVYRCENYEPTKVECSSFETMAEQSCSKADGLVIPFEEDNGASNNLAFVCGWNANGAGSCEDVSTVKDECTKQPLNITSSLYDQADGCRKESTDTQLCWPLIDNSTNILSNYCYLGRKDAAEVICSSGLFDTSEKCKAAKDQWSTDGNGDGSADSLFTELTYCEYLSPSVDVPAGCYYNLPSNESGCGKEVFHEVPASFEEYFDLCKDAQEKTPNSTDMECVPEATTLAGATADSIKCVYKFGPMTCGEFNSPETEKDAARCLAADEHLFYKSAPDGYTYGLSCIPDSGNGNCKPRTGPCMEVIYTPSTREEEESTEPPETTNEWKAYNDICLAETDYRTEAPVPTTEPNTDGILLDTYCVAQMPFIQGGEYNTCTNVLVPNLDCSLPQFQSKDACETMKELQINKIGEDGTFSLECEWVPGEDEGTGECKSGMAKLLVPALMVLVSLLW